GEQNVNFNATDSKGEWVTHEVIITILNVNDPPYWDPVPPDITVEEGTPYNLSAKAADSDSSELYFSAHLFTANASWEIMPISGTENNYANFSLNFDNYEVYLDETSGLCINLTVNDGEYYESTIIDLEVTNVNDKPELHYSDSFDNKLGNFEVMEDGELEFSLLGIDEDFNEELQFDFDVMKFPKYADEPSYMEIAKLNFTTLTPGTAEDYINDYSELMYYNNFTTVVPAEFRFMPDNNDVGYLDINFSVDDMGGESDWVVANISILNTNDAPYFTQVGHYDATSGEHPIVDYTGLSNNATVGEEFKFEVVARDDDFPHDPMEELEFYTENVSLISDGVLEIEQGGNINASIIFNFTEKYIGINLINLTVIDNAGEIDWAWVMVEVWQGPDGAENNPPIANFTFSPSSP
ncbi:MAG: hypothetical protein KAJ51_15810, partial [Thermoplasmata archaeon]|nr:hypothetical protein [Thermoplasmata archaeon]